MVADQRGLAAELSVFCVTIEFLVERYPQITHFQSNRNSCKRISDVLCAITSIWIELSLCHKKIRKIGI